ncbi:hypothetical protein M409DRAFT_27366 [Zasmidium cellare ATCC 36951]|uniref:Tat pathway signal sequence n=1 Tax=Zasmidium cellare ATCC 36951 TaxID=1080233 RepID=A0A6A6C5N7_ZASCE|nr:uncharacterized protein M409DRAFT_27366 [Zasmidium cellare ATCC 36951]KAF2162361.1 hypothetical protein M409DRAFT_27366 [Zasmidium cellare ATCC 36951]
MSRFSKVEQSDYSVQEPLVGRTDSHDQYGEDRQELQRPRDTHQYPRETRQILFMILHISCVAFNVLVFIHYFGLIRAESRTGWQSSLSPAQSAIRYEQRLFELGSIYLPNGTLNPTKPGDIIGDPRPSLDDAWNALMRGQNVRVTKDELGTFSEDDSLIELADGSGYYASLAVFHGLHCVQRLHHFIHKDFYYDDMSDDDLRRLKHHTEHCLDWLRQSIQCNGDPTLLLYHWGTEHPLPLAKDDGKHQCVDWDHLREWVDQRTFNMFEPGLLVHPIYGDPFQGDHVGDKAGISDGESLLHSGGS